MYGLKEIVAMNESRHKEFLKKREAKLKKTLKHMPSNLLESFLALAEEILKDTPFHSDVSQSIN